MCTGFASGLVARMARVNDIVSVFVVRLDLSFDQDVTKILGSSVGDERKFRKSIGETRVALNDGPVLPENTVEIRKIGMICDDQGHSVRFGVVLADREGVLARHRFSLGDLLCDRVFFVAATSELVGEFMGAIVQVGVIGDDSAKAEG